ncbi:MAG: phosphatidate cytidylyltransferase [Treponema sp.]|nr:phosphatidate cytidylyltransferase [Treponema sp.]
MSKTVKRLLTFFIGIPLVLGLVLLEYRNHLALNFVIAVFALLGSLELYNIFSKQAELFPKWLISLFTVSLPIFAYIFNQLNIDMILTIWIMIFEIIFLMGIESLTAKTFENSLKKIAFSALILFYVGFMPTLISYITFIPNNSTYFIILFLLIVFMTDSFAWFFGILFGKGTRGYIAASPNKSLVGFIGGILTTLILAIGMKHLFPQVFVGPHWKMIVISLATSFAAIVGDLIESVFKRSSEIKDSGNIIPGRGGILDSIDSLIIGGPVFYLCIHFLYLV